MAALTIQNGDTPRIMFNTFIFENSNQDNTASTAMQRNDPDQTPSPTTPEPPITLNVGGSEFITLKSTLIDAELLEPYIDGRRQWPRCTDNSYFVDIDPDIFDHVLFFPRNPGIYPLFRQKSEGFDYDLYNRFEAAANRFGIPKLENWIKEKQYLKAVVVKTGQPIERDVRSSAPETYLFYE